MPGRITGRGGNMSKENPGKRDSLEWSPQLLSRAEHRGWVMSWWELRQLIEGGEVHVRLGSMDLWILSVFGEMGNYWGILDKGVRWWDLYSRKIPLLLQSGHWVKRDCSGCEETTEEVGAVVQVVNHGGLDTGWQWRWKKSGQIKKYLEDIVCSTCWWIG